MFSVKYEHKSSKFLKKLAVKSDVKNFFYKVDELAKNPYLKYAKRVEGYNDLKVFSVRIGIYKISLL